MPTPSLPDRFRGCLLGGALGDALGAPVEFLRLPEIRDRYGPDGPADFDRAYDLVGAVTDDTQMTLFTAEGLIRAHVRTNEGDVFNPAPVVYRAYLRWLHTQGDRQAEGLLKASGGAGATFDGWLVGLRALHSQRAPGTTCLSALRSGRAGTPAEPINNSKGCGGVMRAAPAGLFEGGGFALGSTVAAITHGHPSGHLSAGVLAAVVYEIVFRARSLAEAVGEAEAELARQDGHEETTAAVRTARTLAREGRVTAETIEAELGEGWIGEEALAIGLACALAFEDDPERALRVGVTHGGDSDSTGAICGNILGALHGEAAFPARWREGVELRDVILALADDLHTAATGGPLSPDRYPGW